MFTPQQHITVPLRGGPHDDLALHTYTYDGSGAALALLETSDGDESVNLWLFEDEVRALRDACNKTLGED